MSRDVWIYCARRYLTRDVASGFGIVLPNTFGMVQQRNATALKPMLLEGVQTTERHASVRASTRWL